jgi:hypothetical protein
MMDVESGVRQRGQSSNQRGDVLLEDIPLLFYTVR